MGNDGWDGKGKDKLQCQWMGIDGWARMDWEKMDGHGWIARLDGHVEVKSKAR